MEGSAVTGGGLSEAGTVRRSHTQGGQGDKVLGGLGGLRGEEGVAGVRCGGEGSGLAGAGSAAEEGLAPGAHTDQGLCSLQVCVLQTARGRCTTGGPLTVVPPPLQEGSTLVHTLHPK